MFSWDLVAPANVSGIVAQLGLVCGRLIASGKMPAKDLFCLIKGCFALCTIWH